MNSNKFSIFKHASVTYYYSSLFFPPSIRKEVATLYAFVRTADDFVDSVPPRAVEFQEFVRDTWRSWEGKSVDNIIIRDFIRLAKEKNIKKEWIQQFLKAMNQDLFVTEYTTQQKLHEYMHGSAEVVGLMMSVILNIPEEAFYTAKLQGKAMQLLNFIRDVDEDKRLGRVYFPVSVRKKYKLQHAEWDVKKWNVLIRDQIEYYKKLQNQASRGYTYLPLRYRIPVMTAATLYSWTAEQIAKDPEVVWRRKIKPTKWRVFYTFLMILLKEVRR